jgi:hypothetical protein
MVAALSVKHINPALPNASMSIMIIALVQLEVSFVTTVIQRLERSTKMLIY